MIYESELIKYAIDSDGNGVIDNIEFRKRLDETNAQLSDTSKQLLNVKSDISIGLSDFPKLATDLDDTERIQRALDYCKLNNIAFSLPTGRYYVRSLNMSGGMTFLGNGSTLKKPDLSSPPYNMSAGDMKWVRMLNVTHNSDDDSDMTTIKDLNFDGSCWDMWQIEDGYAQEQASMLMLSASSSKKGRLNVTIDNCTFVDNVSDGIHVHTNIVANISNCKSKDCFRGGLTITGGNSDVNVFNFRFQSVQLPDGIDMEVDSAGYNGSKICNANFTNIIIDRDLDIGVTTGSVVNLCNVIMRDFSWILGTSGELNITNSYLKGAKTRLLVSEQGKAYINNTTFESNGEYPAVKIQFYRNPTSIIKFSSCEFKNCTWGIAGGLGETSDVEVENCIFEESCSEGAIGGPDGNIAFAPKHLKITNNKFNNPFLSLQCKSSYTPNTTITLCGNDIINAANTGMLFHDPYVFFKNEIYEYGQFINLSNGANPVFYGQRTLIVDEDPNVLRLYGASKNDVAVLRDKSRMWVYSGNNRVWNEV